MNRILLAAAVLFFTTDVRAGIINGDFETQDLTGWTSFAEPGSDVSAAELTVGSPFFFSTYVGFLRAQPTGDQTTSGWLEQSFNASDGDVLQFDADWNINQPPFGSPTTTVLLEVTGPGANYALAPTEDGPGIWSSISVPLAADGSYVLRLTVSATSTVLPIIGESRGFATARVDNVRLVPEPSSLVMATLAVVGVATYAGRRRRRTP